jgi:hypothetical protein
MAGKTPGAVTFRIGFILSALGTAYKRHVWWACRWRSGAVGHGVHGHSLYSFLSFVRSGVDAVTSLSTIVYSLSLPRYDEQPDKPAL